MVLLDTCTLLWLVADQKQLSNTAKRQIRKAAGVLFVSSISAFEIGIKAHKGLLKLPLPTARWFERALELHGLTEIPVNAGIAILSTELPNIHRDPVDRLLVATAIQRDLALLTPDQHIHCYPELRVRW